MCYLSDLHHTIVLWLTSGLTERLAQVCVDSNAGDGVVGTGQTGGLFCVDIVSS